MTVEALELHEFKPSLVSRSVLSDDLGTKLRRDYASEIDVDFPTPWTENQWRLTSKGWVGSIPLSSDLRLDLKPKVPLGNLFRMLEYAYDLKSFRFLDDDERPSESLPELYERLAHALARRVLTRCRRGLYAAYVGQDEDLPFLRGGLQLERFIRSPSRLTLPCRYEEHTPDLVENRILAWTLRVILRSGLCSDRTASTVRSAFRGVQAQVASVEPVSAAACLRRLYNRLNQDYQPMHMLCRFFLENTGPSENTGDRAVLPFLVNMGRLYEAFVAAWLKVHCPPDLALTAQEQLTPDPSGKFDVRLDLLLRDQLTGRPRFVLDTKYKTPERPSQTDINQVVSYAQLVGCQEAVLIYPEPLLEPLDSPWGNQFWVRSATFSLGSDLEAAGQSFVSDIFRLGTTPTPRD